MSSMGSVTSRNGSPSRIFQTQHVSSWQAVKSACTSRQPRNVDNIRTYLDRHGYRLGEILGEGSYSKVKSCTRYSGEGKFMYRLACKIIDKRRASTDFVTKFLPRELKIVQEICHPNIVRVWEIVPLRDNVYIFMDFCIGGDLLEYVKFKGLISESRSRQYFRQIISAVRYLHNKDIAHRDLKCENVLMSGNEQIKISDFGFARYCYNADGKRILSNTYCGSAAYAAPEILQGTGYNPKLYDCWSIGCVLFIMVTGHMPFDESDIPKMLKFQLDRKLTFPSHSDKLSMSVKNLISHLLEPDVTRRANIEVTANHEWLKHQSRGSASCDGDGSTSTTSTPRDTTSGESGSVSPYGSVESEKASPRDVEDLPSRTGSPRYHYSSKGYHNQRRHVVTRSSGVIPSENRTPRSGTAQVSTILNTLNGTGSSSHYPKGARRR